MTMSALSDELAQVRTKKKEFLAQIERIVPWKEWLTLIQPCYYKGERGNKPYPLETMLRLYLLQNLYDLSDEATAAEAIDSRAFSDFCGVDSSNQVPNGDTIGRFRNLLVKNGLQEKLFAQVVTALTEQGLILKKGTIVDSTIISAPSSTKNKEKKRDPDAHQVKKGNTWHFGYKAHVGVDKDSGLVHTVEATPANVHDVTQTSSLLTGEEDVVYGDSGYLGAGNREDAIVRNKSGRKIKYKINRRPSQLKKLSKSGQYAAKKAEHAKSSVRAKVEHMINEINALTIKNNETQIQLRRAELMALQSQINPHFIYNTLNSIKWMADMQGSKRMVTALDSLIKLMQFSSKNSREVIRIQDEIDLIRDYINLINLKYFDRIFVDVHVEPGLENYETLKFLLQPIVENSIYHGFSSMIRQCTVQINITRKEDRILYEVIDNGKGMSKEKIRQALEEDHPLNFHSFNKIGLYNVNKRIQYIFGEEYGIQIDSEPGKYTRVIVEIPARIYKEEMANA